MLLQGGYAWKHTVCKSITYATNAQFIKSHRL